MPRTWLPAIVHTLTAFVMAAGIVNLPATADDRPDILLVIADDWSWPHAGAYHDPVVKTPAFDRIAREGILFRHAFVTSPSCTPSRNSILTGQWHWRLGSGANLWSILPDRFVTYPELLQRSGYEVGVSGKGFGPGRPATAHRELDGRRYESFERFLAVHDNSRPFCFWLGSSDPHRPYEPRSGAANGIDLQAIRLPACFPDTPAIRQDVADYYGEVQRFDALVGAALTSLVQRGQLNNTMVVVTSDNGMPFPRCKSNLYDSGTRVPLAIRWPGGIVRPGRVVDDLVSLSDLAPTFLDVAGLPTPPEMTGRSLVKLLTDEGSERLDAEQSLDAERSCVLVGKERHVPAQEAPDFGGYPSRGLRTDDFLYIRNFRPDRWPNGTPHYERAAMPGNWYADCDNGPTKLDMIENRDTDEAHRRLYDLAFARRPAEELYDLRHDPDQLHNVAADPNYAELKQQLAERLHGLLLATDDPRVAGGGEEFDESTFLGRGPKHPGWQAEPEGHH